MLSLAFVTTMASDTGRNIRLWFELETDLQFPTAHCPAEQFQNQAVALICSIRPIRLIFSINVVRFRLSNFAASFLFPFVLRKL